MRRSLLLLALSSSCRLLLSSLDEAGNCEDLVDNDGDGAVDCLDDDCSGEALCDATCGDGVVSAIEECDDGGAIRGDGCSELCFNEFCGDGVVQAGLGESCDDGALVSGDGCSAACVDESLCGNGQLDTGEACDDGNNIGTDGCSQVCQLAVVCDVASFPFGQGFATNPANGSCFVLSSAPSSFNTARGDCLSAAGDVASLEDQSEQGIADQLTQGTEAWIGLSDSALEGDFVWLDGAPFLFADFAPGEPNNSLADNPVDGEDCVVTKNVSSEGWIDISCTLNRLFLCKFR